MSSASMARPSWARWSRRPSTRPRSRLLDEQPAARRLPSRPQACVRHGGGPRRQGGPGLRPRRRGDARFEPIDVDALTLTRPVYRPTDEEVDEALAELVAQNRTYEARRRPAPRGAGDQVVIDFVGRIDGEAFEGGAADDAELVLGSGQFIPGFEEQSDRREGRRRGRGQGHLPRRLPCRAPQGQGRRVRRSRSRKCARRKEAVADDALAERLGLADLAALKRSAAQPTSNAKYQDASRFKLKRALLDALDERHDIALPPRMVEAEFATIWRAGRKGPRRGQASLPRTRARARTTLRAEYRKIAERRVRLGLVLAEIGRRENVEVTEVELTNAMREQAMQLRRAGAADLRPDAAESGHPGQHARAAV